jgi:hypothetical protein
MPKTKCKFNSELKNKKFFASKLGEMKMKQNLLYAKLPRLQQTKVVIVRKHISTVSSTHTKSTFFIIPQRSVNFLFNRIQKQKNGQ